MDILRGILGIGFLIGVAWLLSSSKRSVNWRLVISGIALRFIFAFAVLKFSYVRKGFQFVSSFFVVILDFTKAGADFLFGGLATDTQTFGYIFAFQVLPTVVFFSALTSLLYYL